MFIDLSKNIFFQIEITNVCFCPPQSFEPGRGLPFSGSPHHDLLWPIQRKTGRIIIHQKANRIQCGDPPHLLSHVTVWNQFQPPEEHQLDEPRLDPICHVSWEHHHQVGNRRFDPVYQSKQSSIICIRNIGITLQK